MSSKLSNKIKVVKQFDNAQCANKKTSKIDLSYKNIFFDL